VDCTQATHGLPLFALARLKDGSPIFPLPPSLLVGLQMTVCPDVVREDGAARRVGDALGIAQAGDALAAWLSVAGS
jgi:hypothetical protein